MKRLMVLGVLVLLLLGACSSSDDDSTAEPTSEGTTAATEEPMDDATATATDEPTMEATAEPTEEMMGPSARPASPATAPLVQSYNTGGDGTFDAAEMGVAEGEVEAQWYQADGFYVVVYAGLDLEASGPLCPGNSIQTTAGFEYVSNAPTEGADCSSFPTLTSDPEVGPLVCEGVVSYRTAIPSDAQGTLFGTLERPVEGGVMGITGVVATSADIPEIDLASLSC